MVNSFFTFIICYYERNFSIFISYTDGWFSEGNANWELFSPKGNRFYLPGLLGPAWQSSSTTVKNVITNVSDLVDFESKTESKLHISTKLCPILIRKNLHELFPAPEVISSNTLTLITLLTYHFETEDGAKRVIVNI